MLKEAWSDSVQATPQKVLTPSVTSGRSSHDNAFAQLNVYSLMRSFTGSNAFSILLSTGGL